MDEKDKLYRIIVKINGKQYKICMEGFSSLNEALMYSEDLKSDVNEFAKGGVVKNDAVLAVKPYYSNSLLQEWQHIKTFDKWYIEDYLPDDFFSKIESPFKDIKDILTKYGYSYSSIYKGEAPITKTIAASIRAAKNDREYFLKFEGDRYIFNLYGGTDEAPLNTDETNGLEKLSKELQIVIRSDK